VQVLTPFGYRIPAAIENGDDVCAFDAASGAPIINQVENIEFVDYAEWCRWWQTEPTVPAFQWIRVNGSFLLFGEQSIWRNGANVCHVKDLVVGDEIYDDADRPVAITSVEVIEDNSLVWYRFDISGDHSYIVDGLTVHNASRFWVGGTGTWDSSTTTHWAATSGTAGGQSVPGSADTVTFDGASGGGTVTLNFGGTITIQSIVLGAFTGTFDNSVNNNNMTLSASGNAFSGNGSGARTYKLGTATYTLSNNTATWNISSSTNLTYTGNTGCTIAFTGASGVRQINSSTAGLSHGNVTVAASSGGGVFRVNAQSVADLTLASLSITAPNYLEFPSSSLTTITAAVHWVGSASQPIGLAVFSPESTGNVSLAALSTMTWCSFRDLTFTGSPTATDSFNLGNNSGITISGPGDTGSSLGRGVIGS
jgi:hypothetical protein